MRMKMLAIVVLGVAAAGCNEGTVGEPFAGFGDTETGGPLTGPADGSSSSGGGADDSTGENEEDVAIEPAPPTLHRLTSPQLHNTYLHLFGEPLVLPTELPSDDLLYGFTSIAAAGATVSPLAAEQYENATYAVLDQVWPDAARRTALVGCTPTSSTDACVTDFLSSFASKAWRRPASAEEVAALVAVTSDLEGDLGSTEDALKYAAAAVLQSPHFLFRIEIGVEDPATPGLLKYTSWEMASRLSYLLTASPPDDALVALAEEDALVSVETVEAEALRLLEDPKARPALVGFFRDFTNIAKLDELDKSLDQFPQMSETLGPSMRLELERVFESTVFDESGDFRDLFTTKKTFVNEDLARVYGIEGIVGPELQPYEFAEDSPRAGVLTSAAILAVNAHKTQTSPTHRGRFVRIQLLCQDVPPPPAGVDTSLPPPDPDAPLQTLRERLEIHRELPACRSCHALMDPIGFAFERFDAIGAYRDVDDNGLPLDTMTEVDGTMVTRGSEVGGALAGIPQAGACIARRFYEHAGGRLADEGEEPAVEALIEQFVDSDYNFHELVVALVVNDGFRYAGMEVGQ